MNTMAKNSFYCPICKERTDHYELDADEVTAMQGGNVALQALNRLGQYLGGWTLAKFLSGLKFWKCSKCGLGTSRKPDGSIHEHFQNGKRW